MEVNEQAVPRFLLNFSLVVCFECLVGLDRVSGLVLFIPNVESEHLRDGLPSIRTLPQ